MDTNGTPERAGDVRQISPRTVGIGILLGAILGGTAVFVTGSILHERDRERISAWEAQALPLVHRAQEIHRSMPAVERAIARAPSSSAGRADLLAGRVQSFRTELQRIRRTLDEIELHDILLNVATASYSGVGQSIEAVTALERELAGAPVDDAEREPFRGAWQKAKDRFSLGDRLLVRLRCRARFERCATVPFEPRRLA